MIPNPENQICLSENKHFDSALKEFLPSESHVKEAENIFEEFWLSVDYTLKLYAAIHQVINLVTFNAENLQLKNYIDTQSLQTNEAKEKFVKIFTNIVSFTKNIQAEISLIKTFAKMNQNFDSELVEGSEVDKLIDFMKSLEEFRFMKTKEFAEESTKQLNRISSGSEGLKEDLKTINEIKEKIEKVEKDMKGLLMQIFDKNYQINALQGQLKGIQTRLSSKEFQSDKLKSSLSSISSSLSSVISQKSNTPKELEDRYVHTSTYSGWFYSYNSRRYSYEKRDNVEYKNLDNTERELQSLASSANMEIEQAANAIANFQGQIGDVQGRISKLNSEISDLSEDVKKEQGKINKLNVELTKQEKQLKERMDTSSKSFGYCGTSVMYLVRCIECVGKLNKAMDGGELLFKKFSGLMKIELNILKRQLKKVDEEAELERKIKLWKQLFENPDMPAGLYYGKMHFLANTLNPVINHMIQVTLTPELMFNQEIKPIEN